MSGEGDLMFSAADAQLFQELGHAEGLLDDFEGGFLTGNSSLLNGAMSQGMVATAFDPMNQMPDDDQLFNPLDPLAGFSGQDSKSGILSHPGDGELSAIADADMQAAFSDSVSPASSLVTSGPLGSPYSGANGVQGHGELHDIYAQRSLPAAEHKSLPPSSPLYQRSLSMPGYMTAQKMDKLSLSQAQQQGMMQQVPQAFLQHGHPQQQMVVGYQHQGSGHYQEGTLMYPPSIGSKAASRQDMKLGMPAYISQVTPVPVERALASGNTRRLTPIAPHPQQHLVPPAPIPTSQQQGGQQLPQVKIEDLGPSHSAPSPGRADSGNSAGSSASEAKNGRSDTASTGYQGLYMPTSPLMSKSQGELLGGLDANGDGLRPLPPLHRPQKFAPMQRSQSSHALGGLRTIAPAPPMPDGAFQKIPQLEPRLGNNARLKMNSELQNMSPRPLLSPGMMRRVHSTGDIQTLNGMVGLGGHGLSPMERSVFEDGFKVGRYTVEERRLRINRYRQKRTERNFNKKIKYACRKTLADSRPRIRGRFAKNDELEEKKEGPGGESEEEEEELEDEMLMLNDYNG